MVRTPVNLQFDRVRSSMTRRSVTGLAMLLWACSHRTHESTRSATTTPKRGDQVLVESNAAQFYEARVISDNPPLLRVQAVLTGDTDSVQASDTYRLPASGRALPAQSLAICNIERERWIGCRIAEAGRDGARVRDADEVAFQLPWSRIVAPSSLTELNLKRLFDRAGERRLFELEMAKAGPPRSLPGWQAMPGRNALVRLDGRWWLAAVTGSKHEKLRIKLAGADRTAEVERDDAAAEPPYPMEVTQKSRLVLLRPARLGQAWLPVRLVSVDALDAVVEDVERGRRTVPVRDVCPLENQ